MSWNVTRRPYPVQSIPALFLRQARERPAAVAIRSDRHTWTYQELSERAAGIAQALRAGRVGPGDLVAIVMERSAETVAAVFGVLLTGAAYVPLDPDYPDARLHTVLEQADVRPVLTRRHVLPRIGDRWGLAAEDIPAGTVPVPEPPVGPGDRACVLYTSGTTGTPKGVALAHRGPIRVVCGTDYLQIVPDDVVLATANPTFDMSYWETFGALLNGARLVLPAKETLLSAPDLERLIVDEGATVMWLTAGLFHQHVSTHPHLFASLRCLVAGGDVLHPAAVRAMLDRGRPGLFINAYGPTENSMISTAHPVEHLAPDARSVPIGRPIANSTAYVLRADLSLADPGEEGELYVGGDGVALGYHGDPELTSARFVPDPFSDDAAARLYRTGDMARRRPDGVLEFLGRRDRQVKLRGYRVELREIEAAIAAHPLVRDVAVALDEPRPGERSLAAWVIAEHQDGRRELPGLLRRHLGDHLPFFMIPARIGVVDRFPLNASGKIDHNALPTPAATPAGRPPRGAVERTVAAVWSDILGVDAIGRDDDFFAIGGQSLQATQVAAALLRRLNLDPRHGRRLIAGLLSNPTLANFARTAAGLPGSEDGPARPRFTADARLGPLDLTPRAAGRPPREVLLTGGSGFLGVFLVDRLVRVGVKRVHCLVRAADAGAATRRLRARMSRYGLDWQAVAGRVRPIPGDLARPRLGLGKEFDRLAEDVDTIVHNGSHVNFAYPYQALRAANVEGTREVIALAVTGRLKTLHYVSSMAVIAGFGTAGVRHVTEDTPLAHVERLSLGYPETKWVAEQLVRQAGEQGLPVAVHRPYEITGTRDTGLWNTDTLMCALFRTIAHTGLAPDIGWPLDFVPVDFTADALTHIVLRGSADGRVHHITNPRPALLPLLAERLRARGYAITELPYDRWVHRMSELTCADPGEPIAPYLPLFVEAATATDISVKEMYFADTFPTFDRTNFEAAIAGAGLHCPPVNDDLIDLYLDAFTRTGFLRPPAPLTTARH
ncbi:amino acid adenylation domain-containing protein [Nonomuraea sp. MTCD27]|uniref:amino acid adenylation domain-containing protein n=1 Tax=Nonomuraea sp. MTCD27 TaxID=1676747 RepID=UPI0035C11F78